MFVLLTGAFGNVGTSTVIELLARGHRVRTFDLPTRANQRAARKLKGRIEPVWGDLRNSEDVARAVSGVEAIIHLAFIIPKLSVTGVESELHPELAEAVNVGGTRNLLAAACAQPQPPQFVFASSIHVYGQTQDLIPPRTPDETPHPVEHYARHKVTCEQMVRQSGLRWSILRLAASLPIGISLDKGMFDVPLRNRIEYIHTRDAGAAFASAVGREDLQGRLLLIGGGPTCQFYYEDFLRPVLTALGVGMLPAEAFSQEQFATDWFDTGESQRLLHYQTRTLADYVADIVNRMSWRREIAAAFRPLVRAWLLRHSPYWTVHEKGTSQGSPA